jgi:hypothetical protein
MLIEGNLFPWLCISLTNQVLSFPPHDFIQRTIGFSKDLTVNDTETGCKISVFNCNNVLFWTKSGGKLSTWFIKEIQNNGKILSNTYLLSSTIIPLEHKDFGSYSVRIRNSEGSTDAITNANRITTKIFVF